MTSPLISFVVVVKDRVNKRLHNCLLSMWNQTIPQEQIEIVILDYGSKAEIQKYLTGISKRFGARYVYASEQGPWNRARAINLGCQEASSELLAISDIDMLFAPNYAETAAQYYQSVDKGAFFARAVPYNSQEREFSENEVLYEYDKIFRKSEARPTGKGNVVFSKSLFDELRGWEEEYTIHGCEDDDFYQRAKRHCPDFFEIDGATSLVHQWHPSHISSLETQRIFGRNLAMFHSTKDRSPVVRSGRFGKYPELDSHKSFQFPLISVVVQGGNALDLLPLTLFSLKEMKYDNVHVYVEGGEFNAANVGMEIELPVVILSKHEKGVESAAQHVRADIMGFLQAGEVLPNNFLWTVLIPLMKGESVDGSGFRWWDAVGYDDNHQVIR